MADPPLTAAAGADPPPNGVDPMPDEALVARVLAGEPRLFELLMRRYNRRLFRVARAVLRDDGEAEDVVQDAWVRAYGHLSAFEGRARFSTWLTRICVHEALARSRRARRLEPLEAEEQEATMHPGTPEQRASDGEIRRAVEEAVDRLPEPFRAVFVMRSVEEMSVAETAECLGIPEETVKTRAFRARALLKDAISERIDATASGLFDFQGARCDRTVANVLARTGAGEAGK